MSSALGRFAVGLLVGAAVGFFAANVLNRARMAAPAPSASAPAPQPATSDEPELTDDELQQAMAAVDARPNDFEAQFKLGEALLRIAKRPQASIRYYERATVLNPSSADAWTGLGDASFATALAHGREGDYDTGLLDTAASCYERAIDLTPKNPALRSALGMVLTLRTPPKLDRAVEEFRAALDASPTNELALQGLATALAGKGDVAGAEAAVARLERVNPNSPGLERARQAIAAARKGS